jgi:hypothetical protein
MAYLDVPILDHTPLLPTLQWFQSISTIHVYSLQPTALPDLNVLVDANREILSTHGQSMAYLDVPILDHTPLLPTLQWILLPMCTQDLPVGIDVYMIQRRTGARPPPPAAPAVKAQGAKTSKPSTEALPEGFEDAWELAAEDGSDFGSSDLVTSVFAGDGFTPI